MLNSKTRPVNQPVVVQSGVVRCGAVLLGGGPPRAGREETWVPKPESLLPTPRPGDEFKVANYKTSSFGAIATTDHVSGQAGQTQHVT